MVIHSSLRILHAWRLKVKLSWQTKISQFFYNLRKKKKEKNAYTFKHGLPDKDKAIMVTTKKQRKGKCHG